MKTFGRLFLMNMLGISIALAISVDASNKNGDVYVSLKNRFFVHPQQGFSNNIESVIGYKYDFGTLGLVLPSVNINIQSKKEDLSFKDFGLYGYFPWLRTALINSSLNVASEHMILFPTSSLSRDKGNIFVASNEVKLATNYDDWRFETSLLAAMRFYMASNGVDENRKYFTVDPSIALKGSVSYMIFDGFRAGVDVELKNMLFDDINKRSTRIGLAPVAIDYRPRSIKGLSLSYRFLMGDYEFGDFKDEGKMFVYDRLKHELTFGYTM